MSQNDFNTKVFDMHLDSYLPKELRPKLEENPHAIDPTSLTAERNYLKVY